MRQTINVPKESEWVETLIIIIFFKKDRFCKNTIKINGHQKFILYVLF